MAVGLGRGLLPLLVSALLVGCAGIGAAPSSIEGDFLVVALGDSYASGQGAPNADAGFCRAPRWDDRRCNRSRWAPTAQAVKRLEDQGHDVHHNSFTCSGADLEEGLIGPFDGQEPAPADPPLLPQVFELATLAARVHGAGLVHRDFYCAHVFMDWQEPDQADLALIDLQRVFRPRFRWRRWMVKDLAALNHSVPPWAASNADRLRWLRRYLGKLQSKRFSDRSLIRATVAKTRRIARHSRKRGLG